MASVQSRQEQAPKITVCADYRKDRNFTQKCQHQQKRHPEIRHGAACESKPSCQIIQPGIFVQRRKNPQRNRQKQHHPQGHSRQTQGWPYPFQQQFCHRLAEGIRGTGNHREGSFPASGHTVSKTDRSAPSPPESAPQSLRKASAPWRYTCFPPDPREISMSEKKVIKLIPTRTTTICSSLESSCFLLNTITPHFIRKIPGSFCRNNFRSQPIIIRCMIGANILHAHWNKPWNCYSNHLRLPGHHL